MGLMIDLQPSAGAALVVGGGRIAARKVTNLAAGGFRVVVIAPAICEEIAGVGVEGQRRAFAASDLTFEQGYAVVFACTNDRAVNRFVGELARVRGIPVVVADAAGESTFFTPAVARHEGVSVAVSTGGASPRRARDLRDQIVAALGDGWGAQ